MITMCNFTTERNPSPKKENQNKHAPPCRYPVVKVISLNTSKEGRDASENQFLEMPEGQELDQSPLTALTQNHRNAHPKDQNPEDQDARKTEKKDMEGVSHKEVVPKNGWGVIQIVPEKTPVTGSVTPEDAEIKGLQSAIAITLSCWDNVGTSQKINAKQEKIRTNTFRNRGAATLYENILFQG
ncbi:hypothetical protein Y1Q_0016185 [Alligator mississippiensis]|uniref:Uncharacterized protein n=1 Tax=Alligator mississippiensis TaxID=8496 RepID=A0A151P1K2_ALLMI|nr:hypothetical protein Y1Q_0016185 [Alligator mississippiensis]